MTYVLKVLTEWDIEYPYEGSDHHAALKAAKEALKNPDVLDVCLCCLGLYADGTMSLKITDGAMITPLKPEYVRVEEEDLPF